MNLPNISLNLSNDEENICLKLKSEIIPTKNQEKSELYKCTGCDKTFHNHSYKCQSSNYIPTNVDSYCIYEKYNAKNTYKLPSLY